MIITFKDKYKIENVVKDITLTEALDGVAYIATINVHETDKLNKIGVVKGSPVKIFDYAFNTKQLVKIFDGIVWSVLRNKKNKNITLECKERTIYLEESEDEFLFPAGMTATQRALKYCSGWGVPIGDFKGTSIQLSKAIYRNNTILDMMEKDLKETAQKGGNLFKYRMNSGKLDLIELGSNKIIWNLQTIAEDIEETDSLDGIVTQVKVLGKEEENKKTPIIGVYKHNLNKFLYGTIQKIIQDEKIKNSSQAKKKSETLFNTGKSTIRVSGLDINTIRAGDKVNINGKELYVIDITHNINKLDKMDLNLGTLNYIRKEFFCGDI